MRMTLEGKITLALFPPSYVDSQSDWDNHPELSVISELLGGTENEALSDVDAENLLGDDDDESDEEEVESTEEENTMPEISNKFCALAACTENE